VAKTRLTRRGISGVSLVIAVLVVLGLYLAFERVAPLLKGSGCEATGDGQVITLAPSQAGIAATIAGVAQREALPPRAVTVAYAAALQESKLQNLTYGDRDSVGIFQQRPSQGWGKPSQIENPVYATSRFFGALTKVPGYQRLPVYRAAQAVERSADGEAYQQYQLLAAGRPASTPPSWGWRRRSGRISPGPRRIPGSACGSGAPATGGRWRPGWCRTLPSTGSVKCNTRVTGGPRPAAPEDGPAQSPPHLQKASSSADTLRSVGTEEECRK